MEEKCSFSQHWHRNAQYAFCAKNIQGDPCARIFNQTPFITPFIHWLRFSTTVLKSGLSLIKPFCHKHVKENCAQMNFLTETRLFCDMIRVKAMWTWIKSSGSVICQAGRYVSGKTGMLQGQTAAPGNPSRLCRLETWMTLTLSVSWCELLVHAEPGVLKTVSCDAVWTVCTVSDAQRPVRVQTWTRRMTRRENICRRKRTAHQHHHHHASISCTKTNRQARKQPDPTTKSFTFHKFPARGLHSLIICNGCCEPLCTLHAYGFSALRELCSIHGWHRWFP